MRAFIALEVPEEIRQRAENLEKNFQIDGITLVKKDAMHITLQFLGEMDVAGAEKVIAAMKKIRFAPFRVSLSGLSYFTPRLIKVIFVELAQGEKELQQIYNRLGSALTSSRVKFEKENYVPHLTIARVKRVKEMRRLRENLEKSLSVSLGTFEARSLVLKESRLTPDGPVYTDLYKLEH